MINLSIYPSTVHSSQTAYISRVQLTLLHVYLQTLNSEVNLTPRFIRAIPKTNVASIGLYAPVLADFDTPERILSVLRDVYRDESLQWPRKLHDIAMVAAYFGDPQFALKVKGQEVRTSTTRLTALWYPVMSEVRQLPEFKKLVTEINLVEYWRAYGWADACRPLGDDDFECS